MNPSWFEIDRSVPACPCTFLRRLKLETGDAMFLVIVVIHLVQVQEAK